jgi:predicted nucleic acid-binding protein
MPARSAVIDSWAALALLRGERPAESAVRRHLRRAFRGNLRLLMNLVNLGEVYYRMHRIVGEARALEGLSRLRRLPIEIVPVREPLVLEAARLKANHAISYADAFAVATARAARASVLTGDPEILALPRDVVRVVSRFSTSRRWRAMPASRRRPSKAICTDSRRHPVHLPGACLLKHGSACARGAIRSSISSIRAWCGR